MDLSPEDAGVSRSGRVRKKSTKLNDFESPDEIETPSKKNSAASNKMNDSDSDDSDDDHMAHDDEFDETGEFMQDDGKDDDDEDDDDDDDNDDSLHIDEDSNDAIGKEGNNYSQANSLYMSEKLSKKNVVFKDDQVVPRKKAQRKDKGVSRFTAYMLWARENRQAIINANPNMDFSAVNKRLGEMWALVPTTTKYNWRKRAKKHAARGNQKSAMISTGKPSKKSSLMPKNNLVSKGSVAKAHAHKITNKETSQNIAAASVSHKPPSASKSSRVAHSSSTGSDASPSTTYKVNGCSPIDVAAHLKLLGESLNNIGQKLKEHEGQIAVSGSLSVLLDSMLCVLGPLTCLSNQIDELKGAVPEETLTNVLDNIAYIMPGIV